jgi:diadenosine tetraphosphate (Ap4A) HIT family hydrolase
MKWQPYGTPCRRREPACSKNSLPTVFNIGINDGLATGQTILHLHIHLIPRYKGDMPDPRGGIRWIFPDKAIYWKD